MGSRTVVCSDMARNSRGWGQGGEHQSARSGGREATSRMGLNAARAMSAGGGFGQGGNRPSAGFGHANNNNNNNRFGALADRGEDRQPGGFGGGRGGRDSGGGGAVRRYNATPCCGGSASPPLSSRGPPQSPHTCVVPTPQDDAEARLVADVDLRTERPLWVLSSYGIERKGPSILVGACLLGGSHHGARPCVPARRAMAQATSPCLPCTLKPPPRGTAFHPPSLWGAAWRPLVGRCCRGCRRRQPGGGAVAGAAAGGGGAHAPAGGG